MPVSAKKRKRRSGQLGEGVETLAANIQPIATIL